ncbi:MAG: hypothetical protein KAW17_05520 [Candidatus Eisenbacteria sp.]|nr:hypothetical protein [Candidatus Eisenbacteria bacterium]
MGASKSRYGRSDFSRIRTRSIQDRSSKVHLEHLAQPYRRGSLFSEFLDGLPDVLAVRDLRDLVTAIVKAHQSELPRIFMIGGHVIKCGLGPLLIQLMERGVVTAIAGNGSVAIHDFELAMWGGTSEDVDEALAEGEFGMTEETAVAMNQAITRGYENDLGLGEVLGETLLRDAPHADRSVLATAVRLSIPLTIHVGIGTDTIHEHPSASGAALGETSYRDFQVFTRQVEMLRERAVVLNIGSAVIMPEVFLKALSVARNLGQPARGFVAANFDMMLHYRPRENVIRRPTLTGGRGYAFLGRHELLLPLFFGAILEALESDVVE